MDHATDHPPIHLPVLPTGNAAEATMTDLPPNRALLNSAPPEAPAPVPTESKSESPAVLLDNIQRKLLEGKIIEALQTIYDPEIPVNIHELGLIYNIDVEPDASVVVRMTLTAPACPVAGTLPGEVEKKIEAIDEVKSADVQLVWEPPWTRDMMTEAAQLQLGLM